MLTKIQYLNLEERENLLVQNSDFILIEEQNIIDGNFLIFSDTPLPSKTVYVNVPEETLSYLVDLDYRLSKVELGL